MYAGLHQSELVEMAHPVLSQQRHVCAHPTLFRALSQVGICARC